MQCRPTIKRCLDFRAVNTNSCDDILATNGFIGRFRQNLLQRPVKCRSMPDHQQPCFATFDTEEIVTTIVVVAKRDADSPTG